LSTTLQYVHYWKRRHARHYSQEDMCIIGKEEEEYL